MSATFSLFERWKAAKGHASDSAAASQLGVTRAAVSLWRSGRNGAPAVIERMAKELGEDPTATVLLAFSEAAKDADDKRTLGRLARSLGAACIALVVVAPWTTQASAGRNMGHGTASQFIHYAKWLTDKVRSIQARWEDFWSPAPCNPLASYPAPE